MPFPLGKLPPRLDSRTLQLANYLRARRSASSGQGTALPRKLALPPAPRSVDWTTKIPSWPMFANDTIGDCTAAAAAHMIQCWTANASDAFTPTDAQVIAAYSATGHYIVGDAATDQGAVELDVLNFWRQQGIAGHKIDAYVSFSPQNFEHTRQAINLFGGIYIGLALPLSAQNQDVWDVPSFLSCMAAFVRARAFCYSRNAMRNLRISSSHFGECGGSTPLCRENIALHEHVASLAISDEAERKAPSLISHDHRDPSNTNGRQFPSQSVDNAVAGHSFSCDITPSKPHQDLASEESQNGSPANTGNNFTPGSWGGHAVPILAYDADTLTCITWGAKKRMTWEFFARYCDESYAPLSLDWLNAHGTDPAGLDLAHLRAYLAQLSYPAGRFFGRHNVKTVVFGPAARGCHRCSNVETIDPLTTLLCTRGTSTPS